MDFELLDRRLGRAFARARVVEVEGGRIAWRRRPVPFWRYVEEAAEPEDREAVGEGSLEAWPGDLQEMLEEQRWPVLFFCWDGFGPISSVAGIDVFEIGEHDYLCVWDEMQSYRAVARLESWGSSVLAAAITEVLRDNGRPHGVEVFGSLPTLTTNHMPKLLPRVVVKQAYFDWMQWSERDTGWAWAALAEEHYGRIVEPNHLQRCLDTLRTLPRLDDEQALDAFLRQQEADSAAMDDHTRQRLFDEWFEGAYE